jgi:hypothetical protein
VGVRFASQQSFQLPQLDLSQRIEIRRPMAGEIILNEIPLASIPQFYSVGPAFIELRPTIQFEARPTFEFRQQFQPQFVPQFQQQQFQGSAYASASASSRGGLLERFRAPQQSQARVQVSNGFNSGFGQSFAGNR